MSENKEQEKKIIAEIQHVLQSHNYKRVHAKIEEIKTTGRPGIMPYLLDLLNTGCPEEIKQEVLLLISDLKDQGCVQILVDYIRNKKVGEYLSQLIASCWQSSLDFSNDIETFADCFITGNYQTALESFTVIEEMIWRLKAETILSCRLYLVNRTSEVGQEKMALFNELLKLLDEGRTANSEDYPEIGRASCRERVYSYV
jgi:hypothetical protein